jgi:hypothetical protein
MIFLEPVLEGNTCAIKRRVLWEETRMTDAVADCFLVQTTGHVETVSTSHSLSVTESNRLMLVTKIIAVHCHIILCGPYAVCFNVNAGGTYNYHCRNNLHSRRYNILQRAQPLLYNRRINKLPFLGNGSITRVYDITGIVGNDVFRWVRPEAV